MGQTTWENQGYGTNDFVVSFETEKNIFSEYRKRGIIGKISRAMTSMTVGAGPHAKEMDVAGTAAVMSKAVEKGDEVRFTLERNLTGAPTYGEATVRPGDFLSYMHANVFVNQTDSPEFPLIGEMSKLRVADILPNQDAAIRKQIGMWFSEEEAFKFYDAVFTGASRDLSSARGDGGRAINLGLGAGVQVSPENYIVAGNGPVSGTPGTAGYETNLNTALEGLTNTAGDMFTLAFLHNLPFYLADKNIKPAEGMEGMPDAKYICLCDPDLLAKLTELDGSLSTAWKAARERSKDNPFFSTGAIEYMGLMLIPDPYLKKFRADTSGAGIVWGTNAADRRTFSPNALTSAHMVVLGAMGVLEAHNGSVSITENPGKHGKGRALAGHVKQSFMRTRWVPKDGSAAAVMNQNMAVCSFYQGALAW